MDNNNVVALPTQSQATQATPVKALREIDREYLRLPEYSKVAKNLFVGGLPNRILNSRFKTVVQLDASRWYYVAPGVSQIKFLFDDQIWPGHLKFPISRFRDIAKLVNLGRRQGDVLVHCAMGLNRSGLIAGLALVEDGVPAAQALRMLRTRRSPWMLANENFESILLTGREIDSKKLAHYVVEADELLAA